MDGEAVDRDERDDTQDYSEHWSTQTGDTPGWPAPSRPLTPPPGYRALRTDVAPYDPPISSRPDIEHDGPVGGLAPYAGNTEGARHDAGRHDAESPESGGRGGSWAEVARTEGGWEEPATYEAMSLTRPVHDQPA